MLPVATSCFLFTDCFLQQHFAGGGGALDDAYGMDDDDDLHRFNGEFSDEEENLTTNESGIEALELQKAANTIELSDISAENIWAMFQNKTMKGGIMARSLFIPAKALEPKICEPWTGDKTLATRIREKGDQRSLFLAWASAPRVIDWVRLEIFKIVLQKPQTYKTFNVTHANGPKVLRSVDGKDLLQALQASNTAMARVAHLACHPDSRIVLNMLFGSKNIEASDNPFKDKMNVYKGKGLYENKNTKVTGFNITQKIVADFDKNKYNKEWNEDAIRDRWQWFCDEVAEVLQIDTSSLIASRQKITEETQS